MEQKAYSMSLMAIKLDTKEEADYLRQLAQSLRIPPDVCNQIHQQQNAPLMYQAVAKGSGTRHRAIWPENLNDPQLKTAGFSTLFR